MLTPLVLAATLAAGTDPAPGGRRGQPGPIEQVRIAAANLKRIGTCEPGGPSFLYQPAFVEDHVIRGPARPYVPQPGDVGLTSDGSSFWKYLHNLAGTSHPTHSMIVFAMPDGRPAVLEGGPHDTLKCRALEAVPHLASYEAEGRVWVRRRACPLTPMQSARLTEFALALDGRDFALRRLALQLTPLRTRGPVRTAFVGRPHGPGRDRYFCSELVTEALVYAGVMDAATTRPSATYPRDLFFGGSPNPYLNRHLRAMNGPWEPPARWTGSPVTAVADHAPR
jgi:hypothetical protein